MTKRYKTGSSVMFICGWCSCGGGVHMVMVFMCGWCSCVDGVHVWVVFTQIGKQQVKVSKTAKKIFQAPIYYVVQYPAYNIPVNQ